MTTKNAQTVCGDRAVSSEASDLALARREWILATMERQRALSPIAAGIARIEGLEPEDFLHHFYAPSRPVIIANAIEDWPARSLWTPDYLRRTIGGTVIDYQGGRSGQTDYELAKDRYRRAMPFDAFIDMIEGEDGNAAYLTAYNSRANKDALKPLMADIRPIPLLSDVDGMLWIGPAGTFTPLHFDLTNNLLAQVSGTKTIALLPPSEARKLAHHRHVFSDVHDIGDPEALTRHPEAAEARRFEFDLEAGDVLFIPVGWWHQVRAKSFSTMLTFTNFLWPNDAWESFPRD